MKTTLISRSMFLAATLAAAAGCSSGPLSSSKSGQDISVRGPTVVDARTNPGTIELNRDLTPKTSSEVVADVKDFTSPVTDVRLRFLHVPMEVKLKNIGGTTWSADLSEDQLRKLAVGGQTMKYDATVIAKDSSGLEASSKSPITVAIQTPDLSANS